MIANQLILMQEVCKAFPQEWAALIPVVEYLHHTAPQGPHGFSAHDLSCAYAIASPTDAQLAPFRVPKGLPETDTVARLFSNFKEMYGMFTRKAREKSFQDMMRENRIRIDRLCCVENVLNCAEVY